MNLPSLREVTAQIEALYPPTLAEDWDTNGLIVGDPDAPVGTICLAVDPVPETVSAALVWEADLLWTHHPLYLRGTSFVSSADPKGSMVANLIRSGCGLYNSHTNADSAHGGVADALAAALGVADCKPIVPAEGDSNLGLGRWGYLDEPVSLGEFARVVAAALPKGPQGILVGGDLNGRVHKVAVSGGAGDGLLDNVRQLGADVFVTADLRHHPASEHLMQGKPYLINGSHWATERLWCDFAAKALQSHLGHTVKIIVLDEVTEPWQQWLPTGGCEQ